VAEVGDRTGWSPAVGAPVQIPGTNGDAPLLVGAGATAASYVLDPATITAIGPPPWAAFGGSVLVATALGVPADDAPARVDALAEWWRRVLATALDALVIASVYAVAALSLSSGFSHTVRSSGSVESEVTTTGDVVLLLALVAWAIGYFAVAHGSRGGRTLGDRALGIAVRDARLGVSIGYRRALLRSCVRLGLYLALIAPGLVSDVRSLVDDRRPGAPDRLAGSATLRA